MSEIIQPPAEQPEVQPAVNLVRQLPVQSVNLSDADAEGIRVLTIDTPMPDSIVVVLPPKLCEHLQERFNGGVIIAPAGSVPAAPEKS